MGNGGASLGLGHVEFGEHISPTGQLGILKVSLKIVGCVRFVRKWALA